MWLWVVEAFPALCLVGKVRWTEPERGSKACWRRGNVALKRVLQLVLSRPEHYYRSHDCVEGAARRPMHWEILSRNSERRMVRIILLNGWHFITGDKSLLDECEKQFNDSYESWAHQLQGRCVPGKSVQDWISEQPTHAKHATPFSWICIVDRN